IEEGQVFLARGRELEENRAEALTKRSDAPAENAGQPDAVKALRRIRQASICLHAKPKARGRLGGPVEQRRLGRRPVKAAVQLHAPEPLGVVAEHLWPGERRGIERALPLRVAEAGRPGEKHGSGNRLLVS